MYTCRADFLAQNLSAAGVLSAFERIGRRAGLLVVNYHRIGSPAENPYDDGVLSATGEAFEAQMKYLHDRFPPVGLQDVLSFLEHRSMPQRPGVLVTFDDGYRDNYEIAFPILRKLGVHAIFFIPTDYIDRPRVPCWDQVAYVIKQTRCAELVLDLPVPLRIDLRGDRAQAVPTLFHAYAKNNIDEQLFLAHLTERAEVPPLTASSGRELFMSWEQVRELAATGMSIGSHSHTHRNLGKLPEAEQREELTRSKQILEQRIGRPITVLAYPFGWPGSYTEHTKRLAHEVGYRGAFRFFGGINRPSTTDPFEVARISVGLNDTFPIFRTRIVSNTVFGTSRV